MRYAYFRQWNYNRVNKSKAIMFYYKIEIHKYYNSLYYVEDNGVILVHNMFVLFIYLYSAIHHFSQGL